MPLITPNLKNFDDYSQPSSDLTYGEGEIIHKVLEKNNIIQTRPENEERSEFKKILDHAGASVEDASRTIAKVMKHGKYENSQLRAAELVLDLHGIRDKDGNLQKQPVFQFLIKDSSVNLNSIFMPDRNPSEP